MPLKLEDYALIGDLHTAALVGNDGSMDWLCLPRFDSQACFASLLGNEDNGRWLIAPAGGVKRVTRSYAKKTLVLTTEFQTEDGVVRIIDFMPPRQEMPDVVRIVEGVSGRVPMHMELIMRFDYGSLMPWVRRTEHGLLAIAGPNALILRSPVHTRGHNYTTQARFEVSEGDKVPFVLTWFPSHHSTPPRALGTEREHASTLAWWVEWCDARKNRHEDTIGDAVADSLIVLRSLIYEPTGGIVAAPTTSLPERIGGVRNWDYRYCWVRDATLTLCALLTSGFVKEAGRWRDWLLRALAGEPDKLQIMYGLGGERRLPEWSVQWLAGYEGSRPVRVGNAAAQQFQLDVYGELADMLYTGRKLGMPPSKFGLQVAAAVISFLESNWQQPDEGIWEVRGGRRDFVHSKVMAWCAFDRVVRLADETGYDYPIERMKAIRDEVHREVCSKGFDAERNTFTQYYGSQTIDAAALLMGQVGFLPTSDPRMLGTIEAIERELLVDGFVMRYSTESSDNPDGLPPGEAAFLPCSFWYADALCLTGRQDEAREMFKRLLSIRNDVGLLSEEYDTSAKRLVGNFPQAFSHVGLINTANNLTDHEGPAHHRSRRD